MGDATIDKLLGIVSGEASGDPVQRIKDHATKADAADRAERRRAALDSCLKGIDPEFHDAALRVATMPNDRKVRFEFDGHYAIEYDSMFFLEGFHVIRPAGFFFGESQPWKAFADLSHALLAATPSRKDLRIKRTFSHGCY